MKPPFVPRALALALAALAAGTAAAQSVEPAQLPSIMVTAAKRDQPLAAINGAAYVVPEDRLAASGVENTLQLDRVLPGVQISQSGSFLFPVLSVRGVTSAQDFFNPAITFYVDGVPQLPTAAAQQLVDVDYVELLKGPQSTLYGRSALGGVLNIVSRVPDNELRLQAAAGISSRRGYLARLGASGPLVRDLLYGSVSAVVNDAPGRLHNPATGEDRIGGARAQAGAARLRLAPAGSPWELGLNVSGECTRASQDAYVPFDDIDSTEASVWPGFPADLADFHQRRCGTSQSLTGRYDGDGWRLSAMAAWQRLHYSREYPIGPYLTQQPEHWRQQVQEIRLATTGQRTVDGVVGLYRQRVTQSRDYINDLVVPMTMLALDTRSHNTQESLAAYADLTWHVTEALDLSAGLRWSRDRARTDYSGETLNFTTYGYDSFGGSGSVSGSTVLGKASVGYQLNEGWRVYGNVAQGYKPAGYNLAPSSPVDAQAYGRERAISYELGLRHLGSRLRAGAAVYRIDVRDAQLYVGTALGYQHLTNAGRIRSMGVEFDVAWDVDERWTLALEGNWNRARFRDVDPAACPGCDQPTVPFAPTYTLAASVEGRFGSAWGQWRPRLAVRQVGAQYFDLANTLRQEAYALVDARLAWVPRAGLEVSVYADNLFDKRYRSYAFAGGAMGNYAQVGSGRTIGVNVAYKY